MIFYSNLNRKVLKRPVYKKGSTEKMTKEVKEKLEDESERKTYTEMFESKFRSLIHSVEQGKRQEQGIYLGELVRVANKNGNHTYKWEEDNEEAKAVKLYEDAQKRKSERPVPPIPRGEGSEIGD